MKTALTLAGPAHQYSKPPDTLDSPKALAEFYFEKCDYSYVDACIKAHYNPMKDEKQIAWACGCLVVLFVIGYIAVRVLL